MKSNGNNKNVQQFSHTWALLNVLEINFQCVPATLIKLTNPWPIKSSCSTLLITLVHMLWGLALYVSDKKISFFTLQNPVSSECKIQK